LGQGEAEGEGDRAAHRTPHREVQGIVAGGGNVPRRRAEPSDDQRLAAALEDRCDDGAATQREALALLAHGSPSPSAAPPKVLVPMTLWPISTAAEIPPSKAMRAAASTVSPTREASSTG